MSKITTKPFLKKNDILKTFLILYSFFNIENVISVKQWNQDFIQVYYNKIENAIEITCIFFDYEFGPFGEHAYLEWCDFLFSCDGRHCYKLMRSEVNDHVKSTVSGVLLNSKLANANITIIRDSDPENNVNWSNFTTNMVLLLINSSNKVSFKIKWLLKSDQKIYNLFVKGNWNVNGLNCSKAISERYPIKGMKPSKSEVKTESKQIYMNDQTKNNAVKISTQADAVVITGAERGETIKV